MDGFIASHYALWRWHGLTVHVAPESPSLCLAPRLTPLMLGLRTLSECEPEMITQRTSKVIKDMAATVGQWWFDSDSSLVTS